MLEFERTMDIIFGRWKSQTLYAGVKLGVFDCLTSTPKDVSSIAKQLGINENLSYRLLRALSFLNFLKEEPDKRFSLSSQGELLRKDHPQTLQGIVLLEESPEHYQIWKHLSSMVKDGQQNAFLREYGYSAFDYANRNSEYGQIFNQAMSSYSNIHTNWVLEALNNYDFSQISHLCDIGGGHGHLLCNILAKYPHLKGSVLDLEPVINNRELLLAYKMNVEDRCQYIGGDMFKEVPSAEAYMMKMILHDWNDEECVKILSNVFKSSPESGRVFIVEHLVPSSQTPHFSKLFDIHMMCWGTGRERTVEEYSSILEQSGWKFSQTFYPSSGIIGIIEGIKL